MQAVDGKGTEARAVGAQLPADIHASLVETLFGTVGSFVSGIFGGLVVPVIAWSRTGQPVFAACTGLMLALAVLRIVVFLAHRRVAAKARRANAKAWELAYAVGGVGFMLAVGVTAAIMLCQVHDELNALYAVVITLGCAGSLAGRNAGRPRIVMGQVFGVCGPVAVAFLVNGGLGSWGLAFIMVLMIASVKSTTHFLNGMLVTALLSERDSKHRGQQLGTALNSMTHGLCMMASDGSITVMNHRLLEFFPLAGGDAPATLRDLTRHIAEVGGLSPEEAAPFRREILSHVAQREPRDCTRSIGSRVFLFRCEPMESGGSVMVVEDVTAARLAAAQVERLAHFDALTGLTNRFQFQVALEAALAPGDAGDGVALVSIDLDRFKEVNDTLGHHMGDKLLQQVARRLLGYVGPGSLVGRFGGDEFQILLQPCPAPGELDALAARIVAGVGEPYLIDGHAIRIGASIGLAVAPRDAAVADDLLRCADMALYSAKAGSRGTFRHFLPALDEAAQSKRRVEKELRHALAAGHLEVHYQPTVDIDTGRVTTCEALVRWRHPERGLIPPDAFIPAAEETGLIAAIGEFVLGRACEDARSWPEHIRVAVNVSAKQFLLRQDLVGSVVDTLRRTGLPASRLEIEITESTLLDANDALLRLAAFGIRVSLDDFGTGYSSLSYLRRFTFHKIKVDRSFIKAQDKVSLSIIEAVSSLAQALDVELVVEGAETADQLPLLRARGVRLVQGYLFSRPQPASALPPLLDGIRVPDLEPAPVPAALPAPLSRVA